VLAKELGIDWDPDSTSSAASLALKVNSISSKIAIEKAKLLADAHDRAENSQISAKLLYGGASDEGASAVESFNAKSKQQQLAAHDRRRSQIFEEHVSSLQLGLDTATEKQKRVSDDRKETHFRIR